MDDHCVDKTQGVSEGEVGWLVNGSVTGSSPSGQGPREGYRAVSNWVRSPKPPWWFALTQALWSLETEGAADRKPEAPDSATHEWHPRPERVAAMNSAIARGHTWTRASLATRTTGTCGRGDSDELASLMGPTFGRQLLIAACRSCSTDGWPPHRYPAEGIGPRLHMPSEPPTIRACASLPSMEKGAIGEGIMQASTDGYGTSNVPGNWGGQEAQEHPTETAQEHPTETAQEHPT